MGNPASAAAYGQVRLALREMEQTHRRIITSATALPQSVYDGLAFRGVVARNRAVERLRVAIPDRPIIEQERSIVYRILRPRDHPIAADMTMHRNGVEVASLTVGKSRRQAVVTDSPWGLFTTEHSLARLWERARPRVNFVAAIEEAHDSLRQSPTAAFNVAHDEKYWALPTPSHKGSFLCTVRVLNYNNCDAVIYLTASTWIDDSQLWPEQVNQVAAMLHQGDGPRLGETFMLPMELRPAAAIANGYARLPGEPIPVIKPQRARQRIQAISAE